MWSYTGIFILTATIICLRYTAEGVDSEDTCKNRQIPGFICINKCKTVAFCMNFGDEWQTMITETCGDGAFCNQTNGTCIKQENGDCKDGGSFVCVSEGLFPNPYDCHKYYVCHSEDHQTFITIPMTCAQGSVFDAAEEKCSPSATPSSCIQQIDCSIPGKPKPWPTNNNIFYICIKDENGINPYLYRCKEGLVYSEKDYVCVNGTSLQTPEPTTTLLETTSTLPTTTTPLPTTTTTPLPTTPTTPLPTTPTTPLPTTPTTPLLTTPTTLLPTFSTSRPEVTCKEASRFKDEEDCHKYYYCSSKNAQPIHYECPAGTYYNINRCVLGNNC